MIRLAVAIAAALVGSATLAAAAPPPRSATTGASAFLLRITIPGQDTVLLGDLEWPTSTTADVQSFQYPGGRLDRQHRPFARRSLRVAGSGCRDAVVRRGDRRLALQRRDRGGEGHGIRICRCERPFGRCGDEGLRGAGAARSRTRHSECRRERVARRLGNAYRALVGQRQPQGGSAGRTGVRDRASHSAQRRPRRSSRRKRDRHRKRTGDLGSESLGTAHAHRARTIRIARPRPTVARTGCRARPSRTSAARSPAGR